jgi:isocitrate dehydrogenase
LVEENHLRWDSLGEFCALAESLRFLGQQKGTPAAGIMGDAVDVAIEKLLTEGRSPGRKLGLPDNRDSHFWFARYWAEALAAQGDDAALADGFAPLAAALADGSDAITSEFAAARGGPVDLGGYFKGSDDLAAAAMRPSATLNAIIDQ